MKLNVIPTRVEIYDEEMKQVLNLIAQNAGSPVFLRKVVAVVEAVDGVAVKVEIKEHVGWRSWLQLTDAVRQAMRLMEMDGATKATSPD